MFAAFFLSLPIGKIAQIHFNDASKIQVETFI